jgi:hypothetical protein
MKTISFITEENKVYFDFQTIRRVLGYSRTSTQRELRKIENKDVIKYGNRYLYSKLNLFELMEKDLLKKLMRLWNGWLRQDKRLTGKN